MNEDKVREDILKLNNTDISYSLRVKRTLGEYACYSIVKSINDAKSYNGESINDSLKDLGYVDIIKGLVRERGLEVNNYNIIRCLRSFSNYPRNFKPCLAKSIYSHFCNEGDTCLDYSAGFGGRLMGCLCAGKRLKYIGFEPNTNTSKELVNLGNKIKTYIGKENDFSIITDISENIDKYLECESIDFAFSCPPYFKYEEYCNESTQSIVKYPEYNEWLKGYVSKTVKNIYKVLKKGKYFSIYLLDISIEGVKYPLVRDWIEIAENEGFYLDSCTKVNPNYSKGGGNSCFIVLRK